MSIVTRFAPSPTNNLHLGHIYSAQLAYHYTQDHNGKFILRIEDIDHYRCHEKYTQQIMNDLTWLGFNFYDSVRKQSKHLREYQNVIEKLSDLGVVYPCFCTNKEIREEINRAGHAPHAGENNLYPGTCRHLSKDMIAQKNEQDLPYALRLDIAKSFDVLDNKILSWHDKEYGEQIVDPKTLNDVIVSRKDIGTSYHISVVHDDYIQGVTDIIRGVDLFETTHIHRILQALLGYKMPQYHHHPLLINPDTGRRFAKRDNPMTIKMMRENGLSPADVLKLVDQYALNLVAGS